MARDVFHLELEALQAEVLRMGTLVENAIACSVKALQEQDMELAEKVIAEDDLVDDLQLQIEDKCLAMLALQQPMASDLRMIGTALKIVTDLERMADHAVDIARATQAIGHEPLIKPLIDIPKMAKLTQEMVRVGLTAYIDRNVDLCNALVEKEKEVDRLYDQVFHDLLEFMTRDAKTSRQALYLLLVALFLERVADHVTNLGEWTIYLVTGERKDLNDDHMF
ncbi:MAG: phosphate signaling complex protein PhoU [Bacillota bacterium]|jgi:phosphate transport system protein